jgi:hypothetical protein
MPLSAKTRSQFYSGTVDPEKRCHGFQTMVRTILYNRLHLKSRDITRLIAITQRPICKGDPWRMQISVNISGTAFILGQLKESNNGIENDLGYFWIGNTRYEIWSKCK